MKRWMSRLAVVLAAGVTATTLSAAPAHAADTWFRYPGISCGPDQKAVLSMRSSGSGNVNVQYAYSRSGGGISFGGVTFRGAGNHSKVIPSRGLNSYDYAVTGSARVVSRGVSCR
jgi:hypothetical protein